MSVRDFAKFITSHPLTRDNKVASFVRAVRWQLGSRLVSGAVVHEWIGGSKFLVRPGETGLTGNIYAGLHEFEDMAFVLHALREGDFFLDVGANSGSYTLLACGAAGARGCAVEPVPSTFARLVENLRLNHLEGRVKCLNVAAGREAGRIDFTSDKDTMNRALAPGEGGEGVISVELSTLDAIVGEGRPSVMKIDVEGFEGSVLEGAAETLQKPSLQAVIMELGSGARYGFDEERVLTRMLEHGFKTYSYDPARRSLRELAGKNVSSGNTLFLRDVDAVAERLRSAPAFDVHGRRI